MSDSIQQLFPQQKGKHSLSKTLLLKIFLFINVYKAIVGIFTGKGILTGISLLIVLLVFFDKIYSLSKNKMDKLSWFTVFLFCMLTLHLIYSIIFGESTLLIATISAYFQLITPLMLLFIVKNISESILNEIVDFLVKILWPMIIFAIIEFLTPVDIRMKLLSYHSVLTGGDGSIDVAYYLGDTQYNGLRLGSLFFEPLTFAFVSCFMFVSLFSSRKKKFLYPMITNFLALGKLPLFTGIISLFNKIINTRLSKIYYFFSVFFVGIYFAINAVNILQTSPSMANHLLGLGLGFFSALEKPILGHGLGTGGFVSISIYHENGITGPFYNESPSFNGNESTVGIMLYQLGFIITFLYLILIISLFNDIHDKKSKVKAGLVIGYLVSSFLSESVLGITVVSVMLFFLYGNNIYNEKKI